jgi:hypothetical protein
MTMEAKPMTITPNTLLSRIGVQRLRSFKDLMVERRQESKVPLAGCGGACRQPLERLATSARRPGRPQRGAHRGLEEGFAPPISRVVATKRGAKKTGARNDEESEIEESDE